MTATPGPRAMRASNARQVTATTCPLVDIQLSFCSRSASAYFGGNLPQKVKLVNGLAPDLPSRDGRLAAKTRPAGCGTRRAFFRAWLAILRPTRPSYGQLYHCSLDALMSGHAAFGAPRCHDRRGGACCRKAARIRHHAQERTGYKRPFRLNICDGGRQATYNAHDCVGRPRAPISRRPIPSPGKTGLARERFG